MSAHRFQFTVDQMIGRRVVELIVSVKHEGREVTLQRIDARLKGQKP